MNKELKKYIKHYRKRGWEVKRSKKSHYRWYASDGKTLVISGGTVSDHRAWKNHTANLKRVERAIAS